MTDTSAAVLAVDGGQTGIKVRSRRDGLFEHTFPGVQTSMPLLPQLAEAVVAASRMAGRSFPVVVIGTTGLTAADNDPAMLLRLCREAGTVEVRLAHDSITSHLGAVGLQPGVVVACGTGVVTLAVGTSGLSRVDGWGYLIGDAGSGYWLGRAALDRVLRAFDGRGPATALTEVVTRAFPRLDEAYIELQTDPDKVRRIAGFARAVADLAGRDEVAAAICREAGEELALSVVTAARNAELGPEPLVCLIGGVFGAGAVRDACTAAIARSLPGCRLVEPLGDALDGAEALVRVGPEHPLAARVAVARDPGPRSLYRVQPPLRDYAWGSPTAIPELLGRAPDGRPQAELWLGAHPGDPAVVADSGIGLDDLLARHPQLAGAGGLPFLMKVLAAARPLSLQVHPTREQARAGFAREEAAGRAVDHPERSYKDPEHKPEIIVAITPFAALCGFRSPVAAREELGELLGEVPGAGAELLDVLATPDEGAALRGALRLILSGRDDVRALARTAVERAQGRTGSLADTLRIVGASYGDDPGVLATALLNRADLEPGEALYLDAGNIHAYLRGLGIEAMAPSDNVLRGGLTPKYIDVPGLLEIVRFAAIDPQHVTAEVSDAEGVRVVSYRPPVDEFSVHVISAVAGPRTLELDGPALLIVTSGTLVVSSGSERLEVERGGSVFHAAGQPLTVQAVDGPALAYLTTVGG